MINKSKYFFKTFIDLIIPDMILSYTFYCVNIVLD